MRYFILLIAILTVMGVLADDNKKPREIEWKKIYGWKGRNTTAYVDTKSVKVHKEDGVDYKMGMILFYRKEPKEVNIPGTKPFEANIFASYYVADCENYKVATVTDFYFNLDRLPLPSDKPFKIFDYSDNVTKVEEVSKDDPLFAELCPVYI
jgi:hypothetical protein